MLHTARAEGTFYDFQLRLCLGRFLYVQMETVRIQQKSKHEPREMDLPLQQFHWLRRAIGEVFVERGEQNDQLQFGEPPGLPSWLQQSGDFLKIIFIFFNLQLLSHRLLFRVNRNLLKFDFFTQFLFE